MKHHRTTLAELPALVRRARVDGVPVDLRALRLDARGARAVLDATNGILEADGALPLPALARRAARLGAVFPLARPLPPLSLTAACAALPYFVDAFVQQASLVTGDGDAAETPRAPRAANGPSLLAALTARPPLALAVRARVRVFLAASVPGGAPVRLELHASRRAAAERVRALLDDGRPFAVDAYGDAVLVLGAAPAPQVPAGAVVAGVPFAHRGDGRRASFSHARSLVAGDVDAMVAVLEDGGRVVAAPFMGRAGALLRGGDRAGGGAEALALGDVAHGARALTSSWARHVGKEHA